MEKIKVSQDFLYQYLQEHNFTLSVIGKRMEVSNGILMGCFHHDLNRLGKPLSFSVKNIQRMNVALEQIANELRQCIITLENKDHHENSRGKTYYEGCVADFKRINEYFKLNGLTERILGWNNTKCRTTLFIENSPVYGNITEEDVNRINAELLAVAGVLSSYEVVPDGDTKPAERQTATKEKGTRTRMEQTFESKAYPWDNTGLGLQERGRLLREQWPEGLLLYRVNNGYTAEGDDAVYINKVDESLVPFREPSSGMVTLWMDADTMERLLPRFVGDGRRVAITDMYKE